MEKPRPFIEPEPHEFPESDTEATPLQHDMFTGAWMDNRTARQKIADNRRERPQQTEMFSQREIAQFGVSAHPVMNVSPGRLVLVSEDPRTEEEKMFDLQREAESLTNPMFGDQAEADSDIKDAGQIETTGLTEDDSQIEPPPATQSDNKKLKVYRALVKAVEEQITTIWVDQPYQNQFHYHPTMAVLEAYKEGLIPEEIQAAIQIDTDVGNQQRATQPTPHEHIVYSARRGDHKRQSVMMGFRVQQRRRATRLRSRQAA